MPPPSYVPRESLFPTGQDVSRGSLSPTGQDVPRESLFPTGQEAHMSVRDWKALADYGGFDADTHIVDPQAHYTALDSVEHMVVTSSELYRCSGVYRLGNPGKAAEL